MRTETSQKNSIRAIKMFFPTLPVFHFVWGGQIPKVASTRGCRTWKHGLNTHQKFERGGLLQAPCTSPHPLSCQYPAKPEGLRFSGRKRDVLSARRTWTLRHSQQRVSPQERRYRSLAAARGLQNGGTKTKKQRSPEQHRCNPAF